MNAHSPIPLRPTETLRHCASVFLSAGQPSAAHLASRMADDCADLNGLKPGAGDALYRHFAKQMAERAETINRDRDVSRISGRVSGKEEKQ